MKLEQYAEEMIFLGLAANTFPVEGAIFRDFAVQPIPLLFTSARGKKSVCHFKVLI